MVYIASLKGLRKPLSYRILAPKKGPTPYIFTSKKEKLLVPTCTYS